ncbi:MAG TPA: hypothetical protein VGO56_09385 [Pyrinomonadaceae bacterium]|jgi:hypothetical protein|nr:hypothetical protein [Pyrinomonadaceae bacterium]
MSETQLTQEATNGGSTHDGTEKNGLYAKASSHPFLAGGAVLVGASLVYAAGKVISKSSEDDAVARAVHLETSIAIDKSPEELYAGVELITC